MSFSSGYRRNTLPDRVVRPVDHRGGSSRTSGRRCRLLGVFSLRAVVDRGRVPAATRGSAGRASAPWRPACARCSSRADRGRWRSSRDRRVLPQERPALLGVAARAGLVDRVADLEHLHVVRAVRVVARRALHLALRAPACATTCCTLFDVACGGTAAQVSGCVSVLSCPSRTSARGRCGTSCTTGCARRACCRAQFAMLAAVVAASGRSR